MTIVSHSYPFVVGVDTHARSHAFTLLAAQTGELLDQKTFPSSQAGCHRAVSWIARRTSGDLSTLWVIEGTGTYGARLTRAARDAGYLVVEAPRMDARAHRGAGKSDPLDAQRIAQAALPLTLDQLRYPRDPEGERAAMQVLLSARERLSTERTQAINALTALLRTVDLGLELPRPLTRTQTQQIAAWRTRDEGVAQTVARAEAVRLAKRIIVLDTELVENRHTLDELVRSSPAGGLLDEHGFGAVTSATIMAAWSHHGRVRNEAAFAALAGVNPIPASSGNTVRHRLNRRGDRRLNHALHTVVLVRMRWHPPTKEYVQRRRAEGKTSREIIRCLKRYLARHIYRYLTAQPHPATP